MSIVRGDASGLNQARQALDGGSPIIVAMPLPLAFVIAGTGAATVNLAKGRPADQPAGMVAADFALVAPHVDLDPDTLQFAEWLSGSELLNLLVPVVASVPDRLRPATSNGWLAVTLVWPVPARALLDERGHLFVSSANRSGHPVARTAAAANTAFDDELLVLDTDPGREASAESGSGTIVKVLPDQHVEVVRRGIHDARFGGDTERFRTELISRWRQSPRGLRTR